MCVSKHWVYPLNIGSITVIYHKLVEFWELYFQSNLEITLRS